MHVNNPKFVFLKKNSSCNTILYLNCRKSQERLLLVSYNSPSSASTGNSRDQAIQKAQLADPCSRVELQLRTDMRVRSTDNFSDHQPTMSDAAVEPFFKGSTGRNTRGILRLTILCLIAAAAVASRLFSVIRKCASYPNRNLDFCLPELEFSCPAEKLRIHNPSSTFTNLCAVQVSKVLFTNVS